MSRSWKITQSLRLCFLIKRLICSHYVWPIINEYLTKSFVIDTTHAFMVAIRSFLCLALARKNQIGENGKADAFYIFINELKSRNPDQIAVSVKQAAAR